MDRSGCRRVTSPVWIGNEKGRRTERDGGRRKAKRPLPSGPAAKRPRRLKEGEREGQIADIEAPSTECNADVALDWPVVSI